MDYVDIDKVLNDFEMNEDRIFKESRQDTSSASIPDKTFTPSVSSDFIQRCPQEYEASSNRSSRNISNMLLSLDEYISADINTDTQIKRPFETNEDLCLSNKVGDLSIDSIDEHNISGVQTDIEAVNIEVNSTTDSNKDMNTNNVVLKIDTNAIASNVQTSDVNSSEQVVEDKSIPKSDTASSCSNEINEVNEDTDYNEKVTKEEIEIEHLPTSSSDEIQIPKKELSEDEIQIVSTPIRFNTVDDVSDTELETYLNELEELEPSLQVPVNNEEANNLSDETDNIVDNQKGANNVSYNEDNELSIKDVHSESNVTDIISDQIKCDNEYNTDNTNNNNNNYNTNNINNSHNNNSNEITDVNGNNRNNVYPPEHVVSIRSTDEEAIATEQQNDGTEIDSNNHNIQQSNLCDSSQDVETEKMLPASVLLNEANNVEQEDEDSFATTLDLSEDQASITTCGPSDTQTDNDEAPKLNGETPFQENVAISPSISSARSEFESSEEQTPTSELDSLEDTIPSANQLPASPIISQISADYTSPQESSPDTEQANLPNGSANIRSSELGKIQPFWIPDNMTAFCMQCNLKFSFLKRRHHCRACGQVLCSACCSLKAKLEYMNNAEAKICVQCDVMLNQQLNNNSSDGDSPAADALDVTASGGNTNAFNRQSSIDNTRSPNPNPNNPMEYCSVIPPHQQVASTSGTPSISVMVPVGVLKRVGNPPKANRKEKNVIFSDGIRPGCDLSMLDESWSSRSEGSINDYRSQKYTDSNRPSTKIRKANLPRLDEETKSYIPVSDAKNGDVALPPIQVPVSSTDFKYEFITNNSALINRLQLEELKFIVQRNFFVLVKIVTLSCCINKTVICFTTYGLHFVGQDEILILLEIDESKFLPNDIFLHLNNIYHNAYNGMPITELEFSPTQSSTFLGSKEHGGFLFIRPTFQCLQNVTVPEKPYLIGLLIHRWECPWARIFPLRLMLRLGALYRYYPAPHVSIRGRNSVYAEIAHTIISFLADFRSYSYTLATIQGMYILMESRRTKVLIPRNRYDQVMKALNNSSDYILALAGNFSKVADGHLVCVQNTESGCAETHTYSTQAINIQGKPRKVTGASFLVLNGALKTTSGLSGKCSIVEDGLMVQILPKKMAAIRNSLKNMKNVEILCGPIDADEKLAEIVSIEWVENDTEFNIGVKSPIDKNPMDGVPSIRVHHGFDYSNGNHIIRWNEVFIIKSDEESARGKDPIDISKLSEHISKSVSAALVKYLDLLAANGLLKLGVRATLDQDQVCYEAGSGGEKLPPLYMAALDSELIPTLNGQLSHLQLDQKIIIELIFHILNV